MRMLTAALLAVGLATGTRAGTADAPLGDLESHGDVGAPKLAGSATYDATAQEYTLAARPARTCGARATSSTSPGSASTATSSCRRGSSSSARASIPTARSGLIVRGGLDADAPYADAAVHGDGLTSLQFRRSKGAPTEEVALGGEGSRTCCSSSGTGTRYILSAARFGDPFTVTQVTDLALGDDRTRGPLPLLAQRGRARARRLPQRADHPAGASRVRALPRLHRQHARAAGSGRPAAGR